jgi:histidine triad (HIT) family protein
MPENDCIFCAIANKSAKAKILWENPDYIAFENIKPNAPVHILVIPKEHIEKTEAFSVEKGFDLWANLMLCSYEVIKKYELDKTGYQIVNNGGGYHAVNHEHIHILGGKGWRPVKGL